VFRGEVLGTINVARKGGTRTAPESTYSIARLRTEPLSFTDGDVAGVSLVET